MVNSYLPQKILGGNKMKKNKNLEVETHVKKEYGFTGHQWFGKVGAAADSCDYCEGGPCNSCVWAEKDIPENK